MHVKIAGTAAAVSAAGVFVVAAAVIWFVRRVRAKAPVTCGVQSNDNRLFWYHLISFLYCILFFFSHIEIYIIVVYWKQFTQNYRLYNFVEINYIHNSYSFVVVQLLYKNDCAEYMPYWIIRIKNTWMFKLGSWNISWITIQHLEKWRCLA